MYSWNILLSTPIFTFVSPRGRRVAHRYRLSVDVCFCTSRRRNAMSMLSNPCLPSTHESGVTLSSPFAHFKTSFNDTVGWEACGRVGSESPWLPSSTASIHRLLGSLHFTLCPAGPGLRANHFFFLKKDLFKNRGSKVYLSKWFKTLIHLSVKNRKHYFIYKIYTDHYKLWIT